MVQNIFAENFVGRMYGGKRRVLILAYRNIIVAGNSYIRGYGDAVAGGAVDKAYGQGVVARKYGFGLVFEVFVVLVSSFAAGYIVVGAVFHHQLKAVLFTVVDQAVFAQMSLKF